MAAIYKIVFKILKVTPLFARSSPNCLHLPKLKIKKQHLGGTHSSNDETVMILF
jgi:hypothetical protein